MFRRARQRPPEPAPPAPPRPAINGGGFPRYDPPPRLFLRSASSSPALPRAVFPPGMEAEFAERPFGSFGEMLPMPPAAPAPTPQPVGLQMERPPWVREDGTLNLTDFSAEPPPSTPVLLPGGALQEMREAAGEPYEPRFEPGPPAHSEPLQRFIPPEPDWREEERLAVEQNRAEKERIAAERRHELLLELLEEAETSQPYPAKRRPQP